MTSLTVTNARKQLYTLIDSIAKSHEPVHISGKRNSAVLISEKDWAAIQETLYLASIPKVRKSITKGLKTPIEKCDKEIEW
jgi:PHD/YefM family antitoxin component YafN of YafNO toxin-antitoxin module